MPETDVYAVAGRPVLHSRSPELFAAGFRAAGIDALYTRLAVQSAGEIRLLADALDLAGVNVTSPFKESVLPFLDEIAPDALEIGAVNTIVRKGGRLIGRNTDPDGVVSALASRGVRLAGRKALVLGAGGAGRAAAFGLLREGCRVAVVNRTPERAEAAARRLGCAWLGLEKTEAAVRDADIIVSCRSSADCPFDPGLLRPDHVVLDARYQGSRLAEDAAARGAGIVPGRDWLLFQAAAGFALMIGAPAPVEQMREALAGCRPDQRRKAIALSGFMGSGKSTLGMLLARNRRSRFVDTDALVESAAGEAVADIFARRGEAEFRAMEKKAVLGLDFAPDTVVSLGGGAVLDPEIRAAVRDRAVAFWVYSDPEKSAAGLPPGSRPLLSRKPTAAEISAMFRARIPAYAAAAEAVVVNGGRPADLETLAQRIDDEIRLLFPS